MNYLLDHKSNFKDKLIHWYNDNKRDLPWRKTQNPYHIWISEIILQQTRVSQGLSYYLKFIEHYPRIEDLANAREEEILKDWQGLGYYSRARNLHYTAQYISKHLNGIFPSEYSELLKLKGVGEYTAAAIASFAFNKAHAVLDGNVFRVLSRLSGDATPIDSNEGKKKFKELAANLLDHENPSDYNQAIMEFGAIQCLPVSPDCEVCTFQNDCIAKKLGTVEQLPVKEKKIKQKHRFLNYLILEDETQLVVHKRSGKGIWKNLFDFPCIETKEEANWEQLKLNKDFNAVLTMDKCSFQTESTTYKHILSHQILFSRFFHFRSKKTRESITENTDYQIIKKEKLIHLPIPKLIENYLNQETNLLSLPSSRITNKEV